MSLRRITADEFARRLKPIPTETDKRYAFFLGAGCSVSSGISAAGALVKEDWLPGLRELRAPERTDVDAWAKEEFPGYDAENPAAHYGSVMEQLFLDDESRQREIERLCDGRFPGFGYAVVAGLMAREAGCFNVALTTNFDDLIADALYLFTESRPLVILHESLAAYIRATRTRPLVVKLHGDHRLSPQNTTEDTARLKEGIENQVRTVLHDRGLIFIGYGGNDEGIVRMLEALPRNALPLGVYWVSVEEPRARITDWLERREAIWVEKRDFDELMVLVNDVCDLAAPDPKRFEKVFEKYMETYASLSGRIASLPETAADAAELKAAARRIDESFKDWWAVELAAGRVKESDPGQAESIYEEGLTQFPRSFELLNNYALFVQNMRKDYDRAEELFRKSLEIEPGVALTLSNYGVFLQHVREDYDGAEEMYRLAVDAQPRDATALRSYGIFLHVVRKDYNRAEEMYRRAFEVDPRHARLLARYAILLHVVRKDYDRAEEMYRRAFEVDPRDANNLGNYAGLVLSRGRLEEGLSVLERVLELPELTERCDLAVECWFYALAHRPASQRLDALRNLKRVLLDGGRSPDWDLSENIERARQDGHPDVGWLEELARVINEEADISTLDAWEEWREL
ncbi:MAG: SIR2 family protein [Dehalococcoidia bacterium]